MSMEINEHKDAFKKAKSGCIEADLLSFAERAFEEHEHLVEELSTWTQHSENRVHFLVRPYRYLMFKEPQVSWRCLCTSSALMTEWLKLYLSLRHKKGVLHVEEEEGVLAGSQRVGQEAADQGQPASLFWAPPDWLNSSIDYNHCAPFYQESFEGPALIVPDLESTLHLKEDGKKVWRPRFFTLRASGIYFVPKGKTKVCVFCTLLAVLTQCSNFTFEKNMTLNITLIKKDEFGPHNFSSGLQSSSDLTCLVHFENINIYTTKNYKQKFKAPTNFCFVLKVNKWTKRLIRWTCGSSLLPHEGFCFL